MKKELQIVSKEQAKQLKELGFNYNFIGIFHQLLLP